MDTHFPHTFYPAKDKLGSHDGRPWADRSWGSFCRLVSAWRQRRQLRRATLELFDLDDRMLRDLGIDRFQIGYIVRHGRQQPGAASPF